VSTINNNLIELQHYLKSVFLQLKKNYNLIKKKKKTKHTKNIHANEQQRQKTKTKLKLKLKRTGTEWQLKKSI